MAYVVMAHLVMASARASNMELSDGAYWSPQERSSASTPLIESPPMSDKAERALVFFFEKISGADALERGDGPFVGTWGVTLLSDARAPSESRRPQSWPI